MTLPLLPTSLVGSYAQPDWLIDRAKLAGRFPPRVRAKELWRPAPEYLAQAQDDATLLAIRAQERAGLDVLERAQRSVGLAGFLQTHPLERLMRDLATYLRQPGPDRALTHAAAHVLADDRPADTLWRDHRDDGTVDRSPDRQPDRAA